MNTTSIVMAFVLALSLGSMKAQGDARGDFERAYKEYRQHMQAGEERLALQPAKAAYDAGLQVFGKKGLNTANLALNYAYLLNQRGQHEQARVVLKGKLKVLQKHYGKEAAELLPMYMELGMAHFELPSPRKGVNYLRQVASLVEDDENELYRARINFNIATQLISRQGMASARDFMETAHTIYTRNLQKEDVRLGLTSFHLGRFLITDEQYDRAKQELGVAIHVFSSLESTNRQTELAARLLMIVALENMGERDLATEHCLVIGRVRQDEDSDYVPVYKPQPIYPRAALQRRQSGEVVVEFMVDAAGIVVDPAIVSSSSEVFDQAALEAVNKFRYAPRFENGQPVATEGVQNKVMFDPRQG